MFLKQFKTLLKIIEVRKFTNRQNRKTNSLKLIKLKLIKCEDESSYFQCISAISL